MERPRTGRFVISLITAFVKSFRKRSQSNARRRLFKFPKFAADHLEKLRIGQASGEVLK